MGFTISYTVATKIVESWLNATFMLKIFWCFDFRFCEINIWLNYYNDQSLAITVTVSWFLKPVYPFTICGIPVTTICMFLRLKTTKQTSLSYLRFRRIQRIPVYGYVKQVLCIPNREKRENIF